MINSKTSVISKRSIIKVQDTETIKTPMTIPLRKTTQTKAPISMKDQKELTVLIKEKSKIDTIKYKLTEKKNEINDAKEEIKKLFSRSNVKETELKNYIAELNSKMLNINVQYDDKIDDVHKSIMFMITDIQDKIKMEINFTKKEMEREVIAKFSDSENKQHNLMKDKIEEQRKVFEKMNNTRNEIERIRTNFEHTNAQCESLSKENESLRINLQALEEDSLSLQKKLKLLKIEYLILAKENKNINKNEEIENIYGIDFEDEEECEGEVKNENKILIKDNYPFEKKVNIRLIEEKEEDYLESNKNVNNNNNIFSYNSPSKSIKIRDIDTNNANNINNLNNSNDENNFNYTEDDTEEYVNNSESLIISLKDNIKEIKNEYKIIHGNYIDEIKQRNEAQQLLQKCIEDLKIEINKTNKDIAHCIKTQGVTYRGLTQKFEEQLLAKRNNLNSLEHKIKILTFVYDNGFQNTKMKKNKLFSTMSNFSSTKYKK